MFCINKKKNKQQKCVKLEFFEGLELRESQEVKNKILNLKEIFFLIHRESFHRSKLFNDNE
jgi:hypothetical protein